MTTTASVARVLRIQNFRLLAGGQLISSLGDGIALVALTYALLEATGSLSTLGWVLGARYGCLGVFLLFGGVLGDSAARGHILVACDVARAAAQAATAAALMTGHSPMWLFMVLQGVCGTAEAFFSPSARGILPQIVPSGDLRAANALGEMIFNASRVLGPAVGGLLVIASGARGALAVDALSFLISALLIRRMRIGRVTTTRPRLLPDLAEGWSVVRRRRWLWTSIVTFTAFGALTFPGMLVLGPAASWLGLGGIAGWTVFTSAFGAGALIGGLVAIRLPIQRPGIVLMGALVVAALRPATFAAGWSAPSVAAFSFVAGAAMAVAGVTWYTTLQSHLPGSVLSRVSAIDDFGTYLLTPVGYFLAAPVAAAVGLRPTLIFLSFVPIGAALSALCVRDVRQLRETHAPLMDHRQVGAEPDCCVDRLP